MRRSDEIRSLLVLAGPLVAANFGTVAMNLVDTAMVGRLGAAELAGSSIAGAVFFAIAVLGMGTTQGMDPLVAQAVGAGEVPRARRVAWQAFRVALIFGVPLAFLCFAASFTLHWWGIENAAVEQAQLYMWGRMGSVIPLCLFVALRGYLQALNRTRPLIISVVVANICNALLNGVLIFGDAGLTRWGLPALGLPALGVFGAGLASTLCSCIMAGVLALAFMRLGNRQARTDAHVENQTSFERRLEPALVKRIIKLGTPVGLQQLAEVAVFSLSALLAARMGTLAVAGHQIAITLASFTFMGSVGIAQAATVRVGHHVGRGDTPAARWAGFCALVASCGIMGLSGLAFLMFPEFFARLLTDVDDVVAASLPLLQIAAAFQLFDGLQAVAAGALRGGGDTSSALWGNLAGHYLVGLPLSALLGFHFDMGVVGLWWGLCGGLVAVSLVLTWRFHRLSSRPISRA